MKNTEYENVEQVIENVQARRRFLKLLGLGTVIGAATGFGVGRVTAAPPTQAKIALDYLSLVPRSSRPTGIPEDGIWVKNHAPWIFDGVTDRRVGSPVFDVKDYGATGLGVTDDTTAIINAVAAIPSTGGILFFPPGTYLVSARIVLKSNLQVQCSGRSNVTLKAAAVFSGSGNRGVLQLDDGVSTTTISNVSVLGGLTIDLTAAPTTVHGIYQRTRPVQHIRIEDVAFECGTINTGVFFEALGNVAAVPSFDITVRDIFGHNGGGTVWLMLNAAGAGSRYRDALVENIVNLVDINGVADDRVVIVGNFPAGGGQAEVHDVTVRDVSVYVADGLTTGLVNGVKVDPGANTFMHDFLIDGVQFRGNGNATVSGRPVTMQIGANDGVQDYIVRNVLARDCQGVRLVAQRITNNPFVLIDGVHIKNCLDTNSPLEVFVNGSASGDESIFITNVSLRNAASIVGNIPVGIMITSASAPQGWTGQISVTDGYIENVAYGVSNTIAEGGGVQASANSRIQVRRVRVNGVTIGQFNFVNTYDIKDCQGFNPQGVAAITVTASPFTYTNNDGVPEAIYIDAGTVSVITKNAITVYTSTDKTVWLEPGETVTVTYSVLPTMNKDRK